MIQKITPAVLGGCITMGKGGGSITSWVDTGCPGKRCWCLELEGSHGGEKK